VVELVVVVVLVVVLEVVVVMADVTVKTKTASVADGSSPVAFKTIWYVPGEVVEPTAIESVPLYGGSIAPVDVVAVIPSFESVSALET
jgi:hypothetical protein